MRNRHGFLLAEETLKIIIAVICIIFLAGFLISLYLKNSSDKDLEMAKSSLEHLVDEINAGSSEVEIYNPEGLWLISWPEQSSNKKPLSCENLGWQNCICICDNPGIKDLIVNIFTSSTMTDSYKKKCDEKGVCKELSQKIIVEDKGIQSAIKIVNPPLILEIKNGIITKK